MIRSSRTVLSIFLIAILLIGSIPAYSQEAHFDQWLNDFKNRARKEGISTSVINRTLSDLSYQENVIDNYNNQPEFEVTFTEYRKWFLKKSMIQRGKQLMKKHASLLDELYVRYGIQPRYLVAIWGIESRYGDQGKQYSVIPALATLASTTDRSSYFENELLQVLRIMEKHNLDPEKLNGSWAGALGQPQFMPTSYRDYAVDFDRDGFANIWSSEQDVLASIANYLSEHGWDSSKGWGRAVLTEHKKTEADEKIIYQDRKNVGSYLVNGNFSVLKKYNPSNHYALTVGLLGDKIGPLPARSLP